MNLVLNGEAMVVPEATTVASLLDAHGASGRGTAVAVDGVAIRRSDWGRYVLSDGQAVELVNAVQGG